MIRRWGIALLGADSGRARTTRWWHVVVPALAGTLIVLTRVPLESWNILWAEDGTVFLTGAFSGSPFVLVESYAGYLHIVPRVLAGLIVLVVPLQAIPLAFTIVSALVAGLVATCVFLFARERIDSPYVSGLLAAMVALLPVAGGEVIGNLANLHWYLIVGAFWAAITTPKAKWLVVVQCIIVASAVLSDPLAALVVAPLVLVRIIAIRPLVSRAQLVTVVFVAASMVQGVVTVIATFIDRSRHPSPIHPSVVEFSEAYGGRVVLTSFLGVTGSNAAYAAIGVVSIVLAVVAAGAIIAATVWLDRARRLLVIVFVAASVGFSGVVFYLQWDSLVGFPPGTLVPGGRYMLVPILLLASAYAIAADHFASTLAPRRLGWLPVALLAAIVIVPGVVDYRVMDIRAGAQPWDVSIRIGADTCALDPNAQFGEAKIAPDWFYGTLVPCDVLEGAAAPGTMGAGLMPDYFQQKAAQ